MDDQLEQGYKKLMSKKKDEDEDEDTKDEDEETNFESIKQDLKDQDWKAYEEYLKRIKTAWKDFKNIGMKNP